MENAKIEQKTITIANPKATKITLTLNLNELVEITTAYGMMTDEIITEGFANNDETWPVPLDIDRDDLYDRLCQIVDEAVTVKPKKDSIPTFRFKHHTHPLSVGTATLLAGGDRYLINWDIGSTTYFTTMQVKNFLRDGKWIKI